MSIHELSLKGFRSIRQLRLVLEPLNVVVGPNGCGKSNLYKAVRLLHEAACGRLSAALAEEGGIQKAMWAGGLRRGDRKGEPKRMTLAARLADYDYELQLGYPEPSLSLFSLDPLVKEETLWLAGQGRRPSAQVLERRNQSAFLTSVDGVRTTYPLGLQAEESVFGQLSEPHLYPEVSQVRETLRRWRFYHEFAVWPGSPPRAPQVGIRSPVLAHDGGNLASAFQTIVEIGDVELLRSVLADAFPDSRFQVEALHGRFQMLMQRDGILRPLEAAELSDGTLRFLCLAVALLSPRPPAFMALNEPENSLHPDLLPALARLIAEAGRHSQLWVTSHSPRLAELIARHRPLRRFTLTQRDGETVLADEG
ncbi:AAA family ATPase [Chromobacterium haemolyticum]|uniref:Chromosome segregation protein SMC n=1 Tax=Chromobacterium haemolyticum TaxID=394935 RepID=A0A1W0CRD7_9NEIS|nr:AAA family ATPase [Chromobacterium haemolyticum]OQS37344.1 chromosome segregation protein SMC [Chromobacterium haemolyticum]